jgi:zinc protease
MNALRSLTAVLVTLLLVGAAPPTSTAAGPGSSPPPPQPMRQLQFPPYQERVLPNGLHVVLVAEHGIPAVSVNLVIPGGKLFVPTAKAGLAEATAALLTKGTSRRTAPEIAGTIDAVGGVLGASAGSDFASITSRVTSDQLDLALDLVSDVLLHPGFPAAELDRWRQQALSDLQLRAADGDYLADVAFQRVVFGSSPYGAPRIGTDASLRAISQKDLVEFHAQHYVPAGAFLAVVGDLTPETAWPKIEHAFGAWQGVAPMVPAAPRLASPTEKRRILVLDKPDAVQTQIRIGGPGLAFGDPDLVVERVYNAILGGGSDSLLFSEVREKRGLTYGADSGFSEDLQPGLFRAATYTRTEATVETLGVMLDVLKGLSQNGATPADVERKKTTLIGGFPLEIETPDGVAAQVVDALAHGRDHAFVEHYREQVAAVTAQQVARFARERIHPEQATIVLVGNVSAFGEALRSRFGAFEVIPAASFDPLAPSLRALPPAAPGH